MLPLSNQVKEALKDGIFVIVNVNAIPKSISVFVEAKMPSNKGIRIIKHKEKIKKTANTYREPNMDSMS